MAYTVLYRQWRPQEFDDLVGQDHVRVTLQQAITMGKIAHAYLFTGPRGTGKTSTAKILAKALNCAHGPTPQPCNQCEHCQRINAGASMDVVEIDAASNRGIDEIRDLREKVKYAPAASRYKVYIIDEVHMLTPEAFNALLKTLEEPPAHVVFILATTEPHKVPATIQSRCQRYDFHRLPVALMTEHLAAISAESGVTADPAALALLARAADGSMRDAISLLDQCSCQAGELSVENVRRMLGLLDAEWVTRLTASLADRDAVAALTLISQVYDQGQDMRQLLYELMDFLRTLLLWQEAPDLAAAAGYSAAADEQALAALAGRFTADELMAMLHVFNAAAQEARQVQMPRVVAEIAVIRACKRDSGGLLDAVALAERVAALEEKVASLAARPAVAADVKPRREMTPSAPVAPHRPARDTAPPASLAPQQPARQAPPVSREPEAATAAPGAAPADAEQAWSAVLARLLADNKRSVHACVSQGRLRELAPGRATLAFPSAFAKERTEKEDYRVIMEKVFAAVTGHDMRVTCVLETAPQQSARVAPSAPASPEEHPLVRQALEMFGGQVIPAADKADSDNKGA